jgi:heme/copper-type cytochrome/quinol oxidase subunit 2
MWYFSVEEDRNEAAGSVQTGSREGVAWVVFALAVFFCFTAVMLFYALRKINKNMKNEKVNTKKLCIHVTCFALFSISVIPTSIL